MGNMVMKLPFEDIAELAEFMHDEYEKEAKKVGWKTQKSCQVKFMDLPAENRQVMYNIAEKVLELLNENK